MQRFLRPLHSTGAARAVLRRLLVLAHSPSTKNVDDASCKEVGTREGLAESLTVEKNRCILMIDPEAHSRPFRARFYDLSGQFQGQSWGQQRSCNSKRVVYLAFSHGEVAERLKAAVC